MMGSRGGRKEEIGRGGMEEEVSEARKMGQEK